MKLLREVKGKLTNVRGKIALLLKYVRKDLMIWRIIFFCYRRFQRTDWRTERKLNSETFGVASTRRGSFRGRGYYNRGMGGMYRGSGAGGSGFRGGYRGSRGGNRKPANQQQQNNPGSQNRTTNEQSATQSQQNSRVVSF